MVANPTREAVEDETLTGVEEEVEETKTGVVVEEEVEEGHALECHHFLPLNAGGLLSMIRMFAVTSVIVIDIIIIIRGRSSNCWSPGQADFDCINEVISPSYLSS